MKYIIYDCDGRVKCTRNCHGVETLESIVLDDGEFVMEVNDDSHLLGGIFVDIETKTITKIPPNDINQFAFWDIKSKSWVDPRDLPTQKDNKWAIIKNIRATKELESFTCENRVYDSNVSKISGAVQMAMIAKISNSPFTIDWTLYDNSVVSLSADEIIQVGIALGTKVNSIYDTARILREQIESATTAQEVDNINWPI